MLRKNNKILLAVSGGVDSMSMAHRQMQLCGGDSFSIAHCNFNLRGAESDADQELVRSWAENHGICFHCTSFDTVSESAATGESIEMAARRLRYSWFASLCAEYGYSEVHVAHNANDNAETVIMNLTRGTGLKGLCGIRESSPMPFSDGRVLLRRPILGLTRRQIEAYAAENSVPYRNDSTNADTAIRRNAIRHNVIPELENLNPSAVRSICAAAERLSQAQDVLDGLYNDLRGEFVDSDGNINHVALRSQRDWEYLLFRALQDAGCEAATDELTALLRDGARTISGKIFLNGRILTTSDRLVFTGGRDELPSHRLRLSMRVERLSDASALPNRREGEVMMDAASLPEGGVSVRGWQHGDRIDPLGLHGWKKLSDIFTDRHIPLNEKEGIGLVVNAGNPARVLAIPSLGIVSESVKITASTKEVVFISLC